MGVEVVRTSVSRLLVAVAMIAATVVVAPAASFAAHDFGDVGDDHPFHDQISWLVATGIATGYDDGTFRPGQEVTRQAVAAFLHRVAGEPAGDWDHDFTDVPADHPFHDAIAWAAEQGITTGYTDDTFRPAAGVTRQAVAAFIFRAAGEPVGDWGSDFSDVPTSHPFYEAISWMEDMAIAGGYDDGSFRPGVAVTRQAIAAFLARWDDAHADAVVAGSVEQVYLYGADPHTPARLLDSEGEPVDNDALEWSVRDSDFTAGGGTTDANGALIFRGTLDPVLLEFSGIAPGEGYRVEYVVDGTTRLSPELTVLAPDAHPDQTFYEAQQLEEGLTFIETRDGTKLSAYVDLPGPAEDGPYPTLVEYSGYAVSAPPDPDAPLGLNIGAPTMAIGQLLDYATVAVNIRGTGCSGGAFDYFETLQALDGYDAIEAIAAQDWSANVGTAGISYPGISQLFVAATQPPSLTAAAPMAVISDHARDTVYPGGIYNTGFAVEWAEERELDTRYPGGQAWVEGLIDSDHPAAAQCAENVQLRGQNLPLRDRIEANEHANDLWATRSPYDFAEDITTDLFLVNSWQDEQTGGRAAALLDALDLDRDDRIVRFTGTNGTHIESMGPEVLTGLIEFLELHLAERTPAISERGWWLSGQLDQPAFETVILPVLYEGILGDDIVAADVTIPEDRFTGQSYEEALAAYRAEPPARILFETGAGEGPDGFPYPAYSQRFEFDDLPNLDEDFDAAAARRYLRADGTLTAEAPASGEGGSSYVYDPEADDDRVYSFAEHPANDDVWQLQPPYLWTQPDDERSLAFDTPAFDDDQVMVGSASVDLWLASDLRDTDVEVVLSEVRPDGSEMYVTTGWLRASRRELDDRSTALRPRPTFAADDVAPLAAGFNEVRVETFPLGHLFREGSKLRLTIEAPGGNRPLWRFDDTITGGPGVENRVGHHAAAASSIVLPLVGAPTGVLPPLPACTPSDGEDGGMTAVRGQPCRDADRPLPGGTNPAEGR